MSGSSGGSGCSVCAFWNAGESALASFNVASGDGAPAYMSLALDLVIRGIRDPLRFVFLYFLFVCSVLSKSRGLLELSSTLFDFLCIVHPRRK